MKRQWLAFSRRYQAALQKRLQQGPKLREPSAQGLGRQAIKLGLAAPDLAQMHQTALQALVRPRGSTATRGQIARRARAFFNEVITPCEDTPRSGKPTAADLRRQDKTLSQCTAHLAAAQRQLKQGLVQRKMEEEKFKKSGALHTRLLGELRHLNHQILSAQENERKKISGELHDETAQTLLGINVRLITLKREAMLNTQGLEKDIASTQRLVNQSAQTVLRFARELACGGKPERVRRENFFMKTKSKPERRKKKPAHTVRATTPVPPASDSFPVIAMAASEGGLKALSVILGGLPADFPAAIAIVMHLSPHHESILAEILDSRSPLQVKEAKSGDFLCHSCVFVAPPNHHLLVAQDGRLKLSSSLAEKVNYARPSAEPLFVSVAKVYQKSAIAVVLTGGDGDGSFGVQIIKDEGGMVIAQDRPTSENFSMPETSIKTGDVDFILPLDEIGPKLIEMVERGVHAASPSAGPKPSKLAPPADDRGLKRPPGRAPARQNQSHLLATPRYSARRKAAKVTRKK